MPRTDPALFLQLPVIRRIIDDETWLESERRGYCVTADDQVVRENVCKVILRIGAQLRAAAEKALANAPVQLSTSEAA
ncbi:MAG TPA: hypothetical protein VG734_07075 [Lacunisphaera sp.]|nr:hypothetical protein [Lacunisphaera sp.]